MIGRSFDDPRWKTKTLDGSPFPREQQAFARALRERRPVYDVEAVIERPDGSQVIVSANGAPLLDQDGAITAVVASLLDVTEAKRAEQTYKTILSAAIDGFLLVDGDGRILDANNAYAGLLGRSRQELLGLRIQDVEVRETPEEVSAHLEQVRRAGRARFETTVSRKDGGQVDVEISTNYVDIDGGRFFSFIRDISERKRAEKALRKSEAQRFQTIAEAAVDAIVCIDSAGKIVFWNLAAERYFGYAVGEIMGRDVTLLMPKRYRLAHKRGMAHYLETGEARLIGKIVEFQALRKDGTEFPIELSLSPWKSDGKYLFMGIIRDITERNRREELTRRRALTGAIDDIGALLVSELDFDRMMDRVVAKARTAICCEAAGVLLCDNARWVARYLHGLPQEPADKRLGDEDVPYAEIARRTKKLLVMSDAYRDEQVSRAAMAKLEIRSVAAVPLVVKAEVIGVLFFAYRSASVPFTDEQIDFAAKLGPLLALAFHGIDEERRRLTA